MAEILAEDLMDEEAMEEFNEILGDVGSRFGEELAEQIKTHLVKAYPQHPTLRCAIEVHFKPTFFFDDTNGVQH